MYNMYYCILYRLTCCAESVPAALNAIIKYNVIASKCLYDSSAYKLHNVNHNMRATCFSWAFFFLFFFYLIHPPVARAAVDDVFGEQTERKAFSLLPPLLVRQYRSYVYCTHSSNRDNSRRWKRLSSSRSQEK